jgi:hypothetical protein
MSRQRHRPNNDTHDGHHWIVVEKKNHHARHVLCSSLSRAEQHIKERVPVYVAKSCFMDKTLTADCFCIITPTGDVVHVTPNTTSNETETPV